LKNAAHNLELKNRNDSGSGGPSFTSISFKNEPPTSVYNTLLAM